MPVERVKVEGFDDFQETVKKYAADMEKKVFVLFSGSKDQSGEFCNLTDDYIS